MPLQRENYFENLGIEKSCKVLMHIEPLSEANTTPEENQIMFRN